MLLPAEQLIEFSVHLLCAAGVGSAEALQVAGSLVESNLCGHESHGVVRIPDYVDQIRRSELVPGAELHVLNETACILAADACFGFGQVQCARLIEKLLPKARANGISCGV